MDAANRWMQRREHRRPLVAGKRKEELGTGGARRSSGPEAARRSRPEAARCTGLEALGREAQVRGRVSNTR